ncbi:MAG: arginine--tRNA ligase [Gaiellaceae bacterium]
MSLALERLAGELAGAVGAAVELERPSDPKHGDFASNVALRLAPERGTNPRALAEELRQAAERIDGVARAEVAGPGFLNLFLDSSWYGEALAEMLAAGGDYGAGVTPHPQRIQVELVSANPTGPITVGSGRNGAYGDSLARLLAFAGNEVSREYYVNDHGTQIDLFRASVDARRRGEEPPEGGYLGDYVFEIARDDSDPVRSMVDLIGRTLERFRIHVDSWAYQSEMEGRLPALFERLDTYTSDGALYVRSTAFEDEKDRVLVRSPERGGNPTYEAADLAYLADKLERGFERAIYVLGADHHGVREWFRVAARLLGDDPEKVEVILYQLVHILEGGRTKKMSKRRGDIVLLDELIDLIGLDAARWYLVSRGPDQTIELDVELAAEHSQKNPVYYVQYAHARISSILAKAGGTIEASAEPPAELSDEERGLLKRLVEFPKLVQEATDRRAPQAIPTYAIRLADDFHRFYHHRRVIGSKAQSFRLGLCQATRSVIARCLDLIGVEAPETM